MPWLEALRAAVVSQGGYGVAFLSFDLRTIDPVGGLNGDDRYALHLWPTLVPPDITVLKRWKASQ
jgi:hypothetical protein